MTTRWRVIAAIVAVLGTLSGASATAGTTTSCGPGGPWVSTANNAEAYAPSLGPWSNQTLRQVVRVSLGGSQVRIHLSNVFSSQTAQIGHVTVATQQSGANTVEQAPVALTFNGADAVSIGAGGGVVSDPAAFAVRPNTRLLVSIYIPPGANLNQAVRHDFADETQYNYVGGDATEMQAFPTSNTFNFYTLLDGVDVNTASNVGIVAVGDSITDGQGTPSDTDTRWPNILADRAVAAGRAVIDQGIGGNEVTVDQGASGQSLKSRWQRDVLGQPGVAGVVDADGVNDLRHGVSAAALEQAQSDLVASAHLAGLRIGLATITPCQGDSLCTAAVETQRQIYNQWARSGASGADDVPDFDRAVGQGAALNPLYDSGDHLHPNSAGAAMMAAAVDITKI